MSKITADQAFKESLEASQIRNNWFLDVCYQHIRVAIKEGHFQTCFLVPHGAKKAEIDNAIQVLQKDGFFAHYEAKPGGLNETTRTFTISWSTDHLNRAR